MLETERLAFQIAEHPLNTPPCLCAVCVSVVNPCRIILTASAVVVCQEPCYCFATVQKLREVYLFTDRRWIKVRRPKFKARNKAKNLLHRVDQRLHRLKAGIPKYARPRRSHGAGNAPHHMVHFYTKVSSF